MRYLSFLFCFFSFGLFAQKPAVVTIAKDSGILEFREQLITALEKKDMDAFFDLTWDSVATDLCESRTPSGCLYNYLLRDTAYANYWLNGMLHIARMGFETLPEEEKLLIDPRIVKKAETVYEAPYYYHKITNIYNLFVPGKAKIRAAASNTAASLADVSGTILTYEPAKDKIDAEGSRWCAVVLKDGRKGYVPYLETSVNIDYQLLVKKIHGEWKLVYYMARPKC